jgi:hypothetical protein
MRRLVSLGLVALALGAAGCGDTTTNPTGSIVTSAVSPNPATAQPSTSASYQWTAAFTLTLTAPGAGVTVNTANAVVYQATGGIITSTVDPANVQIVASAAGNHIAANGTLPITYNVSYKLPDGSRGVLVRITLSVTDDSGNATSGIVDETVS